MSADLANVHKRFPGISARAFQHPADRAATAALGSIPMLDTVVRRLVELQYERALRQAYLGSSLRVGPEQLPDLWALWAEVTDALDLPERHAVHVVNDPTANAVTIGAGTPMVILNSGLVELLEPPELRVVLAHEASHILADHVLYRTALAILVRLGLAAQLGLLGGLPIRAITSALLEWSRASELSCDRGAALVAGDPRVVCATLMAIAGGRPSAELNLDAFVGQAAEYEDWGGGFDRAQRFLMEIGRTHAFPVRRVRELTRWVQGGDWDRIVGGDYPRREDDVNVRAEAGDAVGFYAERFREAFRDAGESVGSAGQQLADWLRARGGSPDEDPPADGGDAADDGTARPAS